MKNLVNNTLFKEARDDYEITIIAKEREDYNNLDFILTLKKRCRSY